ncbi:hypothetical protein CKO35_02335 [Ectothiorhodospira shaposhnikovii]|uniref:Wadjet anti-phage system protein JetA family protein n=1 Tax=Ectothiorhodospira shaposhnikovii TaxID=1054 RepID=UPI0019073774|nr:Wadjet anti-phage system protein JetA family protein [Ectothiorhodospira shaposhnikovii]MBK1672155.1 hypothetical protein [Ectothiorhodospira shaposhnikovii]
MAELFERLPDNLFSPLTGPNRQVYGRLLLELHPLFFEQIHAEVFPSRETVRADLEEILTRLAVSELAEEMDPAEAAEGVLDQGLAQRVYRRLRSCGWLEEEADGYRMRVTVPPAVGTLWGALVEVARPEQVFYGGMVLSILNNVQRAVEDPRGQALAFRQAVSEARRFRQHLNAMIYGLKGLLSVLASLDDPRRVLGHFFDDFVERFLVADYKKLKTRNNPFRFRGEILSRVRELEFDAPRRQQLVIGYMEQTGLADEDHAWRALERDLSTLRGIFEQVDDHLARVDRYRGQVERRVADTVRYLDRSRPGLAPRLARRLEGMGRALVACPDEDELTLLPLIDTSPLGRQSLRAPSVSRRPPEPRVLTSYPMDPQLLERQRALRAYLDRRRIDPRRMERYLQVHLRPEGPTPGEVLPIETVEDFMAFTHVRQLPWLPGAERLRRLYRVEYLEGYMENPWLRCPRFVVHRLDHRETGHVA